MSATTSKGRERDSDQMGLNPLFLTALVRAVVTREGAGGVEVGTGTGMDTDTDTDTVTNTGTGTDTDTSMGQHQIRTGLFQLK